MTSSHSPVETYLIYWMPTMCQEVCWVLGLQRWINQGLTRWRVLQLSKSEMSLAYIRVLTLIREERLFLKEKLTKTDDWLDTEGLRRILSFVTWLKSVGAPGVEKPLQDNSCYDTPFALSLSSLQILSGSTETSGWCLALYAWFSRFIIVWTEILKLNICLLFAYLLDSL